MANSKSIGVAYLDQDITLSEAIILNFAIMDCV